MVARDHNVGQGDARLFGIGCDQWCMKYLRREHSVFVSGNQQHRLPVQFRCEIYQAEGIAITFQLCGHLQSHG